MNRRERRAGAGPADHRGGVDLIGADAVYAGDERVGAALARAAEDSRSWVASGQVGKSDPP